VGIEERDEEFAVTHDFAPKEREILIEGGLLHWLQEHGTQVAEEAEQGAPGQAE
jgi:hypothetical protein